jgi:hypothetical protein
VACGILPISIVRKIQNCSLTYKDATDFVFSAVIVAKRHNLSHLYVGLPVSRLLLANVYLFNKVDFISEMVINRQHANKSATRKLKGCHLENKLALTIGLRLEWPKSKFNLICGLTCKPDETMPIKQNNLLSL